MGRSYLKMILIEFKKSFGRFAAIFGIVALGVGFLSGLITTTPDMNNSVDTYYDENNMADIFIKANMGLTEDDLEEIKKEDNIKEIMPAYVIDQLMETDNDEVLTTKIYGLPLLNRDEEVVVNELELLEGRMPENNRECLVERKSQYIKELKIGSSLKISEENKDYEDIDDLYRVDTYEVVGIVGNSFHFAKEREFSNIGSGSLDSIIYVDKSAYALEEYTDFYITLEGAKEMESFSSEYQVYTEKVRKRLEDFSKERSILRKQSILDEAREELADGYEEYYEEKAKAEKELADALEEINDAKKELADAKIEIEDAKKEIQDGRDTLAREIKDAEKKIADGEDDLEEARLEILDAEKELADAKKELDDAEKELADAKIELDDAKKEIADAKVELDDGERQYVDGYVEYEDGKKEYEKGQRELRDAKKEIKESEKEIEDGKQELIDGQRELDKAKRDLEDGESQYRDGVEELRAGKSEFLSGITPLAKEIGYNDPEKLIDTAQGRTALKALYTELSGGLEQARAGKREIESQLPYLIQQKEEVEDNLLILQELLREAKESGNLEKIERLSMEIAKLEATLNGTGEEAGLIKIIEGLKDQLGKLETTISDLEGKQEQLPDYEFLISSWDEIIAGERELEYAYREIQDGYREYYKGLDELKEAEREIADGERQIREGKQEIGDAEKELFDARIELSEGYSELLQAKIDLDQGKKEYQEGLADYNEGVRDYEDGLEEFQDGKKEYQDGLEELEDGRRDYRDGLKELEDARLTLKRETEKALADIREGEIELQDGIEDYEEGLEELKDGEIEYADAKKEAEEELEDAYQELLRAEAEIEDLDDPEWFVLDRDSNLSYASFELNSEKVAAIAKVFPIFFYLVAGLVALTTMTRMVEEERSQIGILKALGYKKSTIIAKYLIYCGVASILGSVFGQMVGFKLIPGVIWNTYGVMYHLPEFVADYNRQTALLTSGVAVLSTLGATFFAANDALKEKPALLMLPKAPKKGKRIFLERITPLWSLMSFNMKSTARNLFRYKKHFFMTVIGVSGCTALLVTGFGIRDSIKDIGELQFSELSQYQLEIRLEDDYSPDVIDKIRETENISQSLQVYRDEGYLEYEGEFREINLVAIEDMEKISDYILFRDRKSGKTLDFNENNIIITEKISEELDLKKGDTVIYENSDEVKEEFKIDLIVENYIDNFIYMEKSNYEEAFGKKPRNNTLYTKTGDLSVDEEDMLVENLYDYDDVLSADFISQTRTMFDNLIGSINYIVIVIILASGLLAFIVLYNLTNININERKRELATLKVLGFYNKEVASYIFREITILALIGTLVGLFLGRLLHQFIVLTIEDPNFMFGRDISILSYIIAAVITMLFSIIVDLFMVKKLRNIKMVDSMKAND